MYRGGGDGSRNNASDIGGKKGKHAACIVIAIAPTAPTHHVPTLQAPATSGGKGPSEVYNIF